MTATDDIDPAPTITCTPAAGSLFAIGDTPVQCLATDAASNTANASFPVTVRGAEKQLTRLISTVINATNLPAAAKTRLTATLQSLTADFDPDNTQQRTAACIALRTFTIILPFLATPEQTSLWTADANRIRAVLACWADPTPPGDAAKRRRQEWRVAALELSA